MDNLVNRKITQRSFSFPLLLKRTHGEKKQRWNLIRIDSLPKFLNDNEFLLANHRPELKSVSECFRSIFMLHTETLNVWTHFLGAAAVVLLFFNHWMNSTSQWQQNLYFAVFFLGAVTCMTVSAIFHTVLCHSEKMFKLFAKLDYCGVIFLISTSYILWMHFGFYCTLPLKLFYLLLCLALSMICMAVVLQDKFSNPQYGIFRAGLFISLGLSSTVPGMHFIIMEHSTDLPSASIFWLIIMAIFYLIGGIAYASKLPERLWPGKFDIWLQSHQILHLAVIAGVLLCYKGASILADERNSQTCEA